MHREGLRKGVYGFLIKLQKMEADICKRSEGRQDLLRLLNFINARVFMELNDGGNRWYDPQILYTP